MGETLRHVLNVLATVVPDWLKQQAKPEWFVRYRDRIEDYRLPKDKTEREALNVLIGEDGFYLLAGIAETPEHDWLKQLPAVQALLQVWV